MTVATDLLTEFVARYPAQPATAWFRAIEIDELAAAMADVTGLGLDLGCGDGILTDILFSRIGRTPDLVGIDPDPLETEAARAYGFYRRVHTCGGDAVPEANGGFDYVFSNSVLEHIPDLEPVIAEVARLLRPGGRFFFTVPCPGFHSNLAGSLAGGDRTAYLAELDRRLAHFHYLSAADWRALCSRSGLTLDGAAGYVTRGETRRWETLSRFTGGLLHKLSLGRSRPIEIQRALKLRSLQNYAALPRPIAAGIARAITLGVDEGDAGVPSCLLVTGRR